MSKFSRSKVVIRIYEDRMDTDFRHLRPYYLRLYSDSEHLQKNDSRQDEQMLYYHNLYLYHFIDVRYIIYIHRLSA